MVGTLLQAVTLVAAFLETQSPVAIVGKGAGVIVDPRGYMLTCHHVVGGARRVSVRLRGGGQFVGEVVAAEPSADLALVRLDACGRRFVAQPLATQPPRVRDPVTAVGHPRGYEHTVTVGIISALGREITTPGGHVLRGLLQTDAAIGPGCSGGAVLNARGELVGVPVALYEGTAGIAFVIPAAAVRDFLARHLPAAGP